MKLFSLLLSLFIFLPAWSLDSEYYRFRVYLKDKGNGGFSPDNATEYLSSKAIERRERQNISITESDYPISSSYLDSLKRVGGCIITQSKWAKTVVVENSDSTIADRIVRLPMVDSVKWVWKGKHPDLAQSQDTTKISTTDYKQKDYYGYAEKQIKMLKGDKLHKNGFRGKDMTIAVIDAGFENVNRLKAFEQTSIIGTRNIAHPGKSVFIGDNHGTKVFSCLASNLPNLFVGTAPDADYWLIKSEISESEYPIEEDFWAAAIEFADSVGVDIVTSSLGYFYYDIPPMSYSHKQLDGKTALISRVASMAIQKGILLFSSAGNEGNTYWQRITVPADASGILSVGSVTSKRKHSEFSSLGFTSDGRIKPDIVAMGSNCCILEPDGVIRQASGTSFSTPILAGLGACLWQALPELTAQEIQQLIRQYASQYKHPTKELGYGIPNMYKSYKKGLKDVARSR